METDHIKPSERDGTNDIENAIPLCFECHAEVKCYNPKHPKGRKFTENELKLHKKQWLEICKNKPEIFASVPERDVGPLEGMLLELKFNLEVAELAIDEDAYLMAGCPLKQLQYERAVSEGVLILLPDTLRKKITEAYIVIGIADSYNSMCISIGPSGSAFDYARDKQIATLRSSVDIINGALSELKSFLKIEGDE
ncbi:HNH endonuclease [Candidatus Falkowbacteria bacterium]|nr:HNH endonuclease [Candidatus Falkowbacteria bacterium]